MADAELTVSEIERYLLLLGFLLLCDIECCDGLQYGGTEGKRADRIGGMLM